MTTILTMGSTELHNIFDEQFNPCHSNAVWFLDSIYVWKIDSLSSGLAFNKY